MYNGLQLSANRRFSHGFSFGVAYTYSKSMDDGSAQRDVISQRLRRPQPLGALVLRHAPRRWWRLGSTSSRSSATASVRRQAARRMAAQRDHAGADGLPFTIGGANDTAGVGEVANFDAKSQQQEHPDLEHERRSRAAQAVLHQPERPNSGSARTRTAPPSSPRPPRALSPRRTTATASTGRACRTGTWVSSRPSP